MSKHVMIALVQSYFIHSATEDSEDKYSSHSCSIYSCDDSRDLIIESCI